MSLVFKIVDQPSWDAACKAGVYMGSADDKRDGFIHLSAADQVTGTAGKYFVGQENLVLVAFRATDLGDVLKWEPSRAGALFPHYYGALPTQLALWARAMPLGEDGVPRTPSAINA